MAWRQVNHWKNSVVDRSPKLLVVVYHRVLPYVTSNFLDTIVSEATFIRQLDTLARRYSVVSLEDAIARGESGGNLRSVQVVLTFDDGYWDNYEIVFPILKKKGLRASFFTVTGFISSGKPLWDWELVQLLQRSAHIRRIDVEGEVQEQRSLESRLDFALRVLERLKSVRRDVVFEAIEWLRQHGTDNGSVNSGHDSCMTWEQVRTMSQSGMEIGSHSVTHRSLARIPLEEAIREIKQSKQEIENRTQKECLHFAFPFGSALDYSQTLIDEVKKAGFDTSLLNIHGYNRLPTDRFSLKRIIMTESINPSFLLG